MSCLVECLELQIMYTAARSAPGPGHNNSNDDDVSDDNHHHHITTTTIIRLTMII